MGIKTHTAGEFGSDVTDTVNVSSANNSLQAEATLTVAATVYTFDMSAAINVKLALSAGASETLDFTNLVGGQRGFIAITQNASATTLAYGAGNPDWGSSPTHEVSTGSGDIDVLEYYCDGTNVFLSSLILSDTVITARVVHPHMSQSTGTFGTAPGTDSVDAGVLTIDFSDNQKRAHTLTETITKVEFVAPLGTGNFMVTIKQASGLFSLPAAHTDWPDNAEFVGDIAPVAPTADGAVILLGCYYDGTTWRIQASGEFNA